MFTVQWGVTATYASEKYYTRDNTFEAETKRVNELFNQHKELGINVELRSLEMEEICDRIAQKFVCILLVDAAKLNGLYLSEQFDDCQAFNTEFDRHASTSFCCLFKQSKRFWI